MLEPSTVVLMLFAGILHASWHSLVKSVSDQLAVLAGMGLVATAIFACMLPFLPFPSAPVWIVIAGSACLHIGYKFALARAYALGDLGQAFPLARGFVPLFSVALAFIFLGQLPSSGQMAGIAAVSFGLIWLAVQSIRGGVDRRIFLATPLAGLAVAGYAVADSYGTRLAGDWLAFAAWLNIIDGLLFAGIVYATRGPRLLGELYRQRARVLASGLLGILSISVVLWALSRSAVGPVSALRESSVLFATVIGIAVHREAATWQRLGAAVCIVLGLISFATLR
jgi:drug/metabolite transporter (DMT)-like permease